ncbi:MAG TPA: hypothetical protein PK205_04595 [Promineifilum sp.]|nr:hypothetical protein [Promineifilum sp.]HRO88910.1 hypothetical protein [Promineifilum sp.]HRQ12564.1 hypothetical protein [Promineifilum sp.]
MPNWQPNRSDVVWDWGAANDAANELERAAGLLDELTARRRRAADTAREEWRGRYRDEFDRDLDEMLRRAGELADQMRRKAREIRGAADRARDQQNFRVSERNRWESERREEERREREERERREREQRNR